MINRSIDMIFETSGQPAPTEEEVQFEAQEIVQRQEDHARLVLENLRC